jgi:hypothetical protein
LLLEGKSITALLAQVRAEHGDDVTIVAAEKIRSGGVGGFFAKERYALTVEVEPGSDTPVPAVMHDLAATGTRTNRTPDVHSVMHDRVDPVLAPGSLLDLAAAIDEAEAAENSVILATRPMHSPAEQPMLSTTSPEFASILARLTALDGQQPVIPDSEQAAAEPVERADAYTRLREALSEIAPHIDFSAGVPVVLVIPPAAATAPVQQGHAVQPAQPVQPVTADIPAAPQPPAPVIPRQGRHRRAVDA